MGLTHFNEEGRAHMVEVSHKADTKRTAIARGRIKMKSETIDRIKDGLIEKGDVLSVAQIGGIMAAKKTSDLIPMCHNIFLTGADIRFNILPESIEVEAEVKTLGKTGIEMEALTAVSLACLTIYDMCKAIDKDMVIDSIRLVKKTGGKSGDYMRKEGKVLSINISDKKGVIKEPIGSGLFIEDYGLENDAHSGNWHRQVSLLAIESFDKMENQGIEGLVPGVFAENITTEGIVLYELPVGTRLRIGETIQEVTQIGKECHTGCAISQKVGKCVMPKEGIFTKVIKGGIIKEGDIIEVI
ncbi:MAG: cyclic pyranopterin monophosphate synthase MoaC [Tissierellia bacterium]|nr:cyclic pyranopterin monophosphate synthase MoaC [Tissierellia bacterium]